jgi:inner membrane protein
MEAIETNTGSTSLLDKGKLFIKAIIIFVMALGLWVPTYFIMGMVKERKDRQEEAVADISNKWAGKQTVTGPLLMIPYFENSKDDKGNAIVIKRNIYFLPSKSEVSAKIFPEKRYRGIYQVIVYRSEISINGKFNPLQLQQLRIPDQNILWNEAVILFQVQDNVRGINEDLYIKWADSNLVFNPQPAGLSGMKDAFMANIPFSADEAAKEHSYAMTFSMNGSEQLLFTAAARENKVDMQSSWPNPSFTGVKLPDIRKVDDTGFVASWKFMNRSVPQVWNDNYYDLSQTTLGSDLLIPVDSYNKTERSVKYALLCIILTFASFFLIESIYKRSLHLVQYGLAGLALVLFYTLLLSISEYTGFNLAYLVAAFATIGLVTWFVGSIMKSSKLALFISFVLAVVYSYIFIIIQMQDYALLMGSIGLFIALAIIMFFSRKLQW